jgi:GT2 family glycosyltransferase
LPPYVLLLNPDTIVHPGAIDELVKFMDAHPQVGIAGSRLEDPDGTGQISAFKFPSVASELERGCKLGFVSRLLRKHVVAQPIPERPAMCDWVAGASMIIRREVFEKIGLLDDAYFMYFEEVDFCLRARRAGFECWYVPASRVIHLVGAASGISETRVKQKRKPQYWFDSRRRYFRKNHGFVYTLLADAAFVAGYATYRLRVLLQRKQDKDPPKFLWDSIRNSVLFRKDGVKA